VVAIVTKFNYKLATGNALKLLEGGDRPSHPPSARGRGAAVPNSVSMPVPEAAIRQAFLLVLRDTILNQRFQITFKNRVELNSFYHGSVVITIILKVRIFSSATCTTTCDRRIEVTASCCSRNFISYNFARRICIARSLFAADCALPYRKCECRSVCGTSQPLFPPC